MRFLLENLLHELKNGDGPELSKKLLFCFNFWIEVQINIRVCHLKLYFNQMFINQESGIAWVQ